MTMAVTSSKIRFFGGMEMDELHWRSTAHQQFYKATLSCLWYLIFQEADLASYCLFNLLADFVKIKYICLKLYTVAALKAINAVDTLTVSLNLRLFHCTTCSLGPAFDNIIMEKEKSICCTWPAGRHSSARQWRHAHSRRQFCQCAALLC